MIIYKITNFKNNKIYIGLTTRTLEERLAEHLQGYLYIDRAIRKHGLKSFKAEVVEECKTIDELYEREKFWISELNSKHPNGYNLTDGGDGVRGYSLTQEDRTRKSEEMKKRWAKLSPEERKRRIDNFLKISHESMVAKTPEERAAGARKANAMRTKEERSQIAKKREAAKTPEQRAALARFMASKTPEERSAIARKREQNKRIAREKAQSTAEAKNEE